MTLENQEITNAAHLKKPAVRVIQPARARLSVKKQVKKKSHVKAIRHISAQSGQPAQNRARKKIRLSQV